jgi:hypothetical protein
MPSKCTLCGMSVECFENKKEPGMKKRSAGPETL